MLKKLIGRIGCLLKGAHVPTDHGPASSNRDYSTVQQVCSRCGKALGFSHY